MYSRGASESGGSLSQSEPSRQASAAVWTERLEECQRRLENVIDFLWEVDPQGRYTWCNSSTKDVLGRQPSDMIGKRPWDLMPPTEAARIESIFFRFARLRKPFIKLLNRNFRGDCREVMLETSGAPFFNADGSLAGYSGVDRDVTDREKALAALRQAKACHKAFIDNSAEGIWRYDVSPPMPTSLSPDEQAAYIIDHCIIAECNIACARMYGRQTPGELVGVRLKDLFVPDEPQNMRAITEFVRNGYRMVNSQTVERDSRGQLHYFSSNVNGIVDGGRLMYIWGAQRDETEVRATRLELEASERRMQSIFRAAPIGIGVVRERILVEVNERLCIMMGYTRQELVGQNSRMLYDSQEEWQRVGRVKYGQFRTADIGTVETQWRTKDGRLLDILLSSSPIDPGDLWAGVTFTALDVSARNQMEARRRSLEMQLRQVQKLEAVGQLAGGIAHDFNNLLQIISGHAWLALQEASSEGSLRTNLEHIHQAAERATHLTRQLLVFSRREPAEPKVLRLDKRLDGMMDMLRRVLPENVELEFQAGDDLPAVQVDAGQIEQVVLNLALNARDAMPDGGKLTVATSQQSLDDGFCLSRPWASPGQWVVLSVADNGSGISPQDQQRLFEPFFTTKPVGKGTGLGLAVVYAIVREHGGGIEVQSEVGKGSVFSVYLPAAAQNESANHTANSFGVSGGSELILLAEDEQNVLELGQTVLESAGYRVLPAADGLEAIDLLAKYHARIGLAVLDVAMPGRTGWQVREAAEAMGLSVPVLFVSGYPIEADQQMDQSSLLRKPYDPPELLKKVREMLDSPRKRVA